MRPYRDLVVVVGAMIVCSAIVLLVDVSAISMLAAIPLSLLLPGYAVAAASFGRRLPPPGDMLLMLTVGMSIAVLALGAVVLDLTPGGIHESSWVKLLIDVTAVGCGVAALRRSRPADQPFSRTLLRPLPRIGMLDATFLGMAALAIAVVVIVSATVLPAKNAIGYTRLWMLPSEPGAKVRQVRVGVVNQEQGRSVYRLVLQVGHRKTIRRMDLEPGERRVWRVRAAHPSSDAIPVTARLYRQADPATVDRRVTGWIPGA